MKGLLFLTAALLLVVSPVCSQEKSNDEMNSQIRALGVDKISVSYDAASSTSKVMAVAENFSNREASTAGLEAINFAMGFFYPGKVLRQSPDTIHFSFWVLTKRPRFAESHRLTVDVDGKQLDLGDARYAAKGGQDLEYLNFDVSRSVLDSISSAEKVTFRVGRYNFTASRPQLKLIKAVVEVSDVTSGR